MPDTHAPFVTALRQGLNETGYVDGQSLAIEYRWAQGHSDRLPGLAAELVRRQVAVLVAAGTPPAIAAKAATSTIPIVFTSGVDPIQAGLVTSLSRPDGNITGVTVLSGALQAKRLELLRELMPTASNIVVIDNPNHLSGDERDFETAFAILARGKILAKGKVDGLLVVGDPLTVSRREQMVALAASYSIPVIYEYREFTAAGGLMSYGPSLPDSYRQAGVYAGRILKGAKPADLPVMLPTKFELVINLKTAKALGLDVPPTLIARADEVIE